MMVVEQAVPEAGITYMQAKTKKYTHTVLLGFEGKEERRQWSLQSFVWSGAITDSTLLSLHHGHQRTQVENELVPRLTQLIYRTNHQNSIE